MSVQTIHFLRLPPPPKKKSTHQHFLSAKNPHENNKNHAKKLKLYKKNVDFHRPPLPRPKWMVCTLVKMLTFMDSPHWQWQKKSFFFYKINHVKAIFNFYALQETTFCYRNMEFKTLLGHRNRLFLSMDAHIIDFFISGLPTVLLTFFHNHWLDNDFHEYG